MLVNIEEAPENKSKGQGETMSAKTKKLGKSDVYKTITIEGFKFKEVNRKSLKLFLKLLNYKYGTEEIYITYINNYSLYDNIKFYFVKNPESSNPEERYTKLHEHWNRFID